MGYALDQNGMVTWTDEPVDNGPGGNQTAYDVPSVQDRLQMSLPAQNNSPVPQDILDSVMGNPVAANPVSAPQSVSTGGGQSSSASYSGADFSPGGQFDLAQTKGMTGFKKDVAEGHNKAVKYGMALDAGYSANIDEQKQAAAGIANVEAQRADANAGFTNDIAHMERQNAIDNAADYANIQNKVAGKMAEYEASINDLASSSVNPGRAYSSLTNAAKGGVLATAFITDFLGAKGIKTHGMDYIDQMIQRDIDSQRTDIEIKGQVAAGKLNIYKMFKEQGDSDYMAAEKTRGALFNAAKTEIIGKLAAYDSPMVKARLGEAMAKFGEKEIAHKAEIAKAIQDQENIAVQNATTLRGQSLNAAEARASRMQADRHFEATRADARAAAAGAGGIDSSLSINDPTTGEPIGYISKEDNYEKVTDHVVNMKSFTDTIMDWTKYVQEAGKVYGGPGNKAFESAIKVKRQSIQGQIAAQIAKMNNPDGRISDSDIEAANKILTAPGYLNGLISGEDPVESAISNAGAYGSSVIRDYQGYLNTHIRKIDDTQAAALPRGGAREGTQNVLSAKQELFGSMSNGNYFHGTDTEIDRLIGKIDSSGAKNSAGVYTDSDVALEIANKVGVANVSVNGGTATAPSVPRWLDEMDKLSNTISSPANTARDKEEQGKAIKALWSMANPDTVLNPDGSKFLQDTPEEVKAAAWYYIQDLSQRPNSAMYTGKLTQPPPEIDINEEILKYKPGSR